MPAQPLKVLLVDDDPDDHLLIRELLDRGGELVGIQRIVDAPMPGETRPQRFRRRLDRLMTHQPQPNPLEPSRRLSEPNRRLSRIRRHKDHIRHGRERTIPNHRDTTPPKR